MAAKKKPGSRNEKPEAGKKDTQEQPAALHPEPEVLKGQSEADGAPDSATEDAAASADKPATEDEPLDADASVLFPVVGIGASAGGLEAVTELLQHLPHDTGMAFVLVQHLDPRHKSNLGEILSRSTKMPVREIEDGMKLEPGQFYVTPPDKEVAMLHGVLHLMARSEAVGRHMPIDGFFRSLAQDQGNRAIAVVLSGTGSDGAPGLRIVKAEGGITLTQSPESAKYAGMPQSAIATGLVDIVLPTKGLAEELVRISRHPHLEMLRRRGERPPLEPPEALQKIFILLRKATGVDFTHYKQSTVERRLSRRMVLHKIDSLKSYAKHLEQNPAEINSLFEDMLINVTSFFREPEVFETLKKTIFPRILADRDVEAPVRIWVPACSTGEEAYSIAMSLVECWGNNEIATPVQIFATDISDLAIERARSGKYLEDIAESVSPERLRRFFTKEGQGYQVVKSIRDMCIFARQNVTRDPPFSNLDLLSCRNLLIYMAPTFQRRIIPTFHYALKPTGFLLLGSSETIGSFPDLFSLVDRVHRIYSKKPASVRMPIDFGGLDSRYRVESPNRPSRAGAAGELDLQREADRIVLAHFGPPGVVVNSDMEILQFRGQTGRYLEPLPGAASLNLLKMVREGLALDLRAAIRDAGKQNAPVRKEGIQCRHNGNHLRLNVEVIPIRPAQTEDTYFLVLFDEGAASEGDGKKDEAAPPSARRRSKGADREVGNLREELARTQETLQHIIEENETANEELRAANEEIQSANEELQSTNEELETAKEELQSTNEELTTLNVELESQNTELNQALDDFNNLHNSVNIPVVLLGNDLKIRSFTPPAEHSLKLLPSDNGRALNELRLGIEVANLDQKVLRVIEFLNTHEEEVRANDGRWYSMRIHPYRTAENKITGAVLVMVDIYQRKVAEEDVRNAKILTNCVMATVREPVVVLEKDMRVRAANPPFYKTFRLLPAETEGYPIYELDGGKWDIPELRKLLSEVLPGKVAVEDFELNHDFSAAGRRKILVNARRIEQAGDRSEVVLLAFQDRTDERA